MPASADDARIPRLTARGAATRRRIVDAAAKLIYAQGVGGTSLDDVMDASGTGRSQLYHYFADKDALVAEVITTQVSTLLEAQSHLLGQIGSLRGLKRWRDAEVVDTRTRHGAYGCPIGSLASELADRSESARTVLAACFETWESYLAAGLERMRAAGVLASEADPASLASAVMAALQGGLLLAQTTRDPHRLELALDMALHHVASFAATG
ncbi:MAG: TetR/AcrR family transcriptional regulator [Nakamurella sp.]